MTSEVLQYLQQIAAYFKLQGVKLTIDSNMLASATYKNKTVTGVQNILLMFMNVAKANLHASTPIEQAKITQWIEYVLLYCINGNTEQILQELNEIFMVRTYLVNDRLTIADILLYCAIYNMMDKISYLDKEKNVHLCRWFDNMQQDKQLRQKNKLVDFSTNYLVSVAPARHH